MTEIKSIPGLTVTLVRNAQSDVIIHGFHAGAHVIPGRENHEYHVTIRAAHVADFTAALGGNTAEDAWEKHHIEMVYEGETAWLRAHGIPFELSVI